MASIEYKNVVKRFENGAVALNNFNLKVEDGELVVLVGASGCGKSTALRLLAGLESPTEGEILIDNKRVNLESPQQRNIAMVFQNYALYPHMKVRANLEFPLRMSNIARDQIALQVSEIAELLGLTDLLDRKPAQLSGGQRQRVAMGRALVRDPSVFLLDEPLSNLDAKLRAQIRGDIAEIQQRLKKTTLYVTHDQTEAMTLGDRVVVLNNGELQQIGTPEELYKQPENIFVAKFIGSPGMNILNSRIIEKGHNSILLSMGSSRIELALTEKNTNHAQSLHVGQNILIGIRPEALTDTPSENSVCIRLKVVSVEYLGHESLVYLDPEDNSIIFQSDSIVARLQGQYHRPIDNLVEFFVAPHTVALYNEEHHRLL